MFTRDEKGEVDRRRIINEIECWAISEIEKEDPMFGVLLCEGTETSIDKDVYEAVFPDLLVVPVGGCTNVPKYLSPLRRRLAQYELYAFGIIDRDALSKTEIKKQLSEHRVYTTKLPFIENIICTPEILRFVCIYKGVKYEELINQVQEELMKALWKKMKEALPINLGIEKNEKIISLSIGASTKRKSINKKVCESNILYSYRDKVITTIIGSHIGVKNRKEYYAMIREMLNKPKYHDDMAKAFSKFIPKFEIYDFEEYL